MQYLLIAVTIASAGIAVVMCAMVMKMLREERRRSDARVEALVAMADLPASTEPHVAGVEGLFTAPESPSPWGRRLGAAALGVVLLVAAVFAFNWFGGGAVANDTSVSAGAPAAAPLELLSLTHSPGTGALTITGLVQNPRGGAALSDVTAVALLFSPDGAFVGSGRAPLDFTRLDPGSESPFVVKVPTSKRVARYRVSFRGPDGAVIAHVDRRGSGPVARKE